MKKSFIAVLAKITILFLVFAVGIPAAHAKLSERQRHAVTKDGKQVYFAIMQQAATIQQLRAQQPLRGEKIDFKSLAARQIKASLINEHRLKIAAAGIKPKNVLYHYTNALNGFAALMTAAQANDLARQPGVASVQLDQMRYKHTENSPTFMKLTVRRGPWDQGIKGEDVIVGVIDTGIWPEHPSFADDGSFPDAPVLDDSRPNCEFGNTAQNPDDAPFTCNNKLIGARQMLDTYRAVIGAAPDEYDSARDDDGHGTHTASTAAGNSGVEATIYGIPRGTISGIAPRAH
ncbi:MAG: protease inhibitor I9 family protein, partial [Desulfobacterales bacterium]|nr:protease inhibitor I9 family protein [Desulfobacterales bacterium]